MPCHLFDTGNCANTKDVVWTVVCVNVGIEQLCKGFCVVIDFKRSEHSEVTAFDGRKRAH